MVPVLYLICQMSSLGKLSSVCHFFYLNCGLYLRAASVRYLVDFVYHCYYSENLSWVVENVFILSHMMNEGSIRTVVSSTI